MHKLLLITLATLTISSARADYAVTNAWDVDVLNPVAYITDMWRGESMPLTARTSVSNIADSATFLWQTGGMGSAWWSTNATITASGEITTVWTPAMDSGASSYSFFFRVGNDLYRPFGTIKMKGSPGTTPNELPIPTLTIDYSVVTVLNAPWATAADIAAIVEEDPEALPIATAAYIVGTNAQAVAATKVSSTRTVNGKALSSNIVLDSDDIGAVRYDSDLMAGFAPEGLYIGNDFSSARAGIDGTSLFIGNGVFGFGGRLGFDSDGISQTGKFSVRWPSRSDDSQIATLADISDSLSTKVNTTTLVAATNAVTAAVAATYATSNWVESIRGIHIDIASNVVYHVVVSNGHWLIQEVK